MKQIELRNFKVYIISVMTALLCTMLVLTTFASSEKYQLGTTEKAWWSDTTIARWKKVNRAKKYQVRLYEDDVVVTSVTVENPGVDFSKYMQDGNDYYFEVSTYAKNSTQRSGEWVESEIQTVSGRGDVTGRWRSYQQGKKYQRQDGSYVTDAWYLIAGKWYYFNADGYARTGWLDLGGQWYYLNAEGEMQKGWLQLDVTSYYLKSDGSMAVGWVEARPGEWYYMYPDGKMASNTVVDGFPLNESGLYTAQ